ncbi:alpha-ketoacid dehydrogenase subunit beta [Agathobaculum sp. LCP25S3_E8]|uniref:alpha-ketoacid dehydrogenase subunit beta n=1 Tax=Agathobaculum sp. LCP25S3_E8 TaxID=3438735 RepID=UPI003F91BC38
MKTMTYLEALRSAMEEELTKDENVFLMGEDIGKYGGCYGVTSGLVEKFGADRVMDTPISELAITGAAVGAAMQGKRPVVEIMYADFLPVCADQIVNQACKMRYILGKDVEVPLVIRTAYGGGGRYSFNHSQSPEAWFLNAPGLTIMMPSTPADAKGMMVSAIRSNNPVLFFEQKHLYKTLEGAVPEEEYEVPIGKGDIKREGKDITVVATGWMVHKALEAAENLQKDGIEVEVLDPRTLKPLDEELILQSVRKTGRLLTVHEACLTGGFGAEVCAIVTEKAFDSLKKPVKRLAAPDSIIPFAPNLEDAFYPDTKKLEEAIRSMM